MVAPPHLPVPEYCVQSSTAACAVCVGHAILPAIVANTNMLVKRPNCKRRNNPLLTYPPFKLSRFCLLQYT